MSGRRQVTWCGGNCTGPSCINQTLWQLQSQMIVKKLNLSTHWKRVVIIFYYWCPVLIV